jgi:hypothetical protein
MGRYTLTESKLIFGGISLVSKVVSFVVAVFLDHHEYSDMIDLAVGCVFLSSGFVHIMPRTSSHVSDRYPFSSLIAISVFAVLTLFCFVRDSIALMDENILTTCEMVTDHDTEKEDASSTIFTWAEQVPALALYVALLANTIAVSIWVATLDIDDFIKHTIFILVMNFFEFIGVAKFVVAVPMPNVVYWILTVVAAGAPSIIIAYPIANCGRAKQAAGYVSSCLLGIYLFMGSIAVHSAVTQTKRHVAVTCAVLFFGFAVPAAIHAGDR